MNSNRVTSYWKFTPKNAQQKIAKTEAALCDQGPGSSRRRRRRDSGHSWENVCGRIREHLKISRDANLGLKVN